MKRLSETSKLVPYGLELNGLELIEEEGPLTNLIEDISYVIFNELSVKDLRQLLQTSKHFYKYKENLPMWKNLVKIMCEFKKINKRENESYAKLFKKELAKNNPAAIFAKVCFECENLYIKRNMTEVLEMADRAIKQTDKDIAQADKDIAQMKNEKNKIMSKKINNISCNKDLKKLNFQLNYPDKINKDLKKLSIKYNDLHSKKTKYLSESRTIITVKNLKIDLQLKKLLLSNLLLKKGELLYKKRSGLSDNLISIDTILKEVSKKMTLFEDKEQKSQQAQINYLNEMITYLNFEFDPNKKIELNQFSDDVYLSDSCKFEAKINLCTMILDDEIEEDMLVDDKINISKKEAIECLENILNEKNISIEQLAVVNLSLAKEYYKQKSNQKAESCLNQIFENLDVSNELRAQAGLRLAIIRLNNIKDLDEDKKIIKCLFQIKEFKDVDSYVLMKIDYYLALFCYHNRTNEMTNDDAFDLLVTVHNYKNMDEDIQCNAFLYKALFRYQNRTNKINDEEAFELLNNIDLGEEINEDIRYEASLYKAIMWYEKRTTNEITREQALEILDEIIQGEDISENLISKAEYYKGLILNPKEDQHVIL